MVVLCVNTSTITFKYQTNNTKTIETIIQELTFIYNSIKDIQTYATIDISSLPQHLQEIYERVMVKSLSAVENDNLQKETIDILLNDIEKTLKIIDLTPSITKSNEIFNTLVCCKKQLDHEKNLKQLYGENDKLTLKVILENN